MNWRRASLLMFGSSLAIELATMVALEVLAGSGIDFTGAVIDQAVLDKCPHHIYLPRVLNSG